ITTAAMQRRRIWRAVTMPVFASVLMQKCRGFYPCRATTHDRHHLLTLAPPHGRFAHSLRIFLMKLSILDLAFIAADSTAGEALKGTLDLARHAEEWGYERFWLAEHHNMVGIASAATAVAIGYVAAGTKTIRVGAGGIMLPNHSPLVIAEQFGTLESLYPGRIDLGLGRAPGSDGHTTRALRRS